MRRTFVITGDFIEGSDVSVNALIGAIERTLLNPSRVNLQGAEADGMTTEEAVAVLERASKGAIYIETKGRDAMPIEEAIAYLEHGPEMVKVVNAYVEICEIKGYAIPGAKDLLAKLPKGE